MNEEMLETTVKDADRFPCPACGADMAFAPETQALRCSYCGHSVDLADENQDIKENDLAEGEKLCSTDWGSATKVVHCETCGAQTILEANTIAKLCSFCGSAHVVKRDELPGIRPESVLPFKVPEKKARDAFTKWIRGRFFAPSDVKSKHQLDRMTGIYIPFWTYDSDTHSAYTAERGTHYWVSESYTTTENGKSVTKTRQVRKTRWRPVSGTHGEFFDDVQIHASDRLDKILGGRVGKFDLKQLVGYKPEFLSGFVAEKYSIGLKDGWERAKEEIRHGLNRSVTRKIGGDEVRFLRLRTSYDKMTYKHTLLPLWVSGYHYKNKLYNFIINGQNGEVHGEAPVSAWKVAGTVAVAALVIWILVMVFGGQQ